MVRASREPIDSGSPTSELHDLKDKVFRALRLEIVSDMVVTERQPWMLRVSRVEMFEMVSGIVLIFSQFLISLTICSNSL